MGRYEERTDDERLDKNNMLKVLFIDFGVTHTVFSSNCDTFEARSEH